MALAGNSLSLKTLARPLRDVAPYLLQVAPSLGATSVRVTSAKRSRAQQTVLYNNFIRGKSQYPAAKPGTSKHELGLAVDIVVEPLTAQMALGRWWQSIGGTWGGEFQDPIHFEL